ncbi:dephospho-CoA kinase [Thalassiella azotivora]
MLRVGLTGGTGAGKSTAAARLGRLGAVVVDADALAREVVAPGTAGLAEVVEEFGDRVLAADGSLDRGRLAALVFADPDRRRALEAVTHPRIAARTAELVAAAPADAVLVHDVPLLVEKRMGPGYHLVVVVDAPPQVRVRRLVASRGMGEDDAWARVRSQATDAERREAADVLLPNAAGPDELAASVDRLWGQRLVPFERNVRAGVPAARDAVPPVVQADPTWPQQGRRLAARVALAAGRGSVVRHVGGTAAGRPGPDVIELEVTPGAGEPAAARAAQDGLLDPVGALAGALAAAGFAPVPGAEGLYRSCDPGRPADLRVLTG